MSHTYTPSSAGPIHSGYTHPNDGDPPKVADVNPALEAKGDDIAYLNARAFYGDTGYIHVPLIPLANANSRFTYITAGTGRFCWVQADITDQGLLIFEFLVPVKGKLVEVVAEVDGNGGGTNHTNLPANKPDLELWRTEYSAGGAPAQVGATITDPSADFSAYDTNHTIVIPTLTEVISSTRKYQIRIRGESGANAAASALALCDVRLKLDKV